MPAATSSPSCSSFNRWNKHLKLNNSKTSPYDFVAKNSDLSIRLPVRDEDTNNQDSDNDEYEDENINQKSIPSLELPTKRKSIHETQYNVLRISNNNYQDRSLSEPPLQQESTPARNLNFKRSAIAETIEETAEDYVNGNASESESERFSVQGEEQDTSVRRMFNPQPSTSRDQGRLSGFLGNRSKSFRASTGELSFQKHLETAKSLFSEKDEASSTSIIQRSLNPSLYGSSWSLNSGGGSRFNRTISPFYGGRTMYGGAAAYSRREHKLQQTLRVPVQMRPSSSLSAASSSNNSQNSIDTIQQGPVSSTSKRILELLNTTFTSPLKDARKMGTGLNPSIRAPALLQKGFSENDFNRSKAIRLQTPKTPYARAQPPAHTTELQVPTISQLLDMKKLQKSTDAARKIATNSKSSVNEVSEYQLPLSSNEQNGTHTTSKQVTKVKPKVTSTRVNENNTINEKEVTPTLNLPNVKLPDLKKVPTFEIKLTSAPSTAPSFAFTTTSTPMVGSKKSDLTTTALPVTQFNSKFTFSSPVPISLSLSTNSNASSQNSSKQFKFSEPLKVSNEQNLDGVVAKLSNSSPKVSTLKQGSCIDALFGTKKVEDTTTSTSSGFGDILALQKAKWECPGCFIRNDQTKDKCEACETPKPGKKSEQAPATTTSLAVKPLPVTTDTGFKNLAAQQNAKWECSVCMIRNDQDKTKCSACESPKPGQTSTPSRITTSKPATVQLDSGFKNLVAQQNSKWECEVCSIRNEPDKNKCVACETPKPGEKSTSTTKPSYPTLDAGFKSIVSKQNANWECTTCMTRNEPNRTKCSACEMAKPGSESNSVPQFAFNLASSSSKSGAKGFTFGVTTSSTTAVASPPKPNATGFVFGASTNNASTTPATGFSFGVPKSSETNKETATSTPSKVEAAKPTFSFGKSPAASDTVSSSTPPKPGFSFGSKPLPLSTQPVPNKDETDTKQNKENKKETTGFNFGSKGNEAQAKPSITFGSAAVVPASSTSGNTFLKPANKEPLLIKPKEDSQVSSSTATATTTSAPVFGSITGIKPLIQPATTTTSSVNQNAQGGLLFGNKNTASPLTATGFSFGAKSGDKPVGVTSTSTTSLFENKSACPTSSGTNAADISKQTPTAGFSFKSTPAQSQPSTTLGSTTSIFGRPATQDNKSHSTFGSTPSFGSTSATTPVFGSFTNTTQQQQSTTVTTAPPGFSFGNNTGITATNSTKPTTPFVFGGAATNTNQPNSAFTSPAAQTPQPTNPFERPATTNIFGSASSTGSSNQAVVSPFGSPSSSAVIPAATPTATPTFGSSGFGNSGAPIFGSSTFANSNPPSFGGNTQNTDSNKRFNSGFSFGSSQPSSAASQGVS